MNLIKRCLDANPLNRPTADELHEILGKFDHDCDKDQTELEKQIKKADEINKNLPTSNPSSTSLSYETHTEAIYTSRLLNFNNHQNFLVQEDY